MMTDEERRLLDLTVDVWNGFVALPAQHPEELHEMGHAIHRVQHLIMVRPTRRAENRRHP